MQRLLKGEIFLTSHCAHHAEAPPVLPFARARSIIRSRVCACSCSPIHTFALSLRCSLVRSLVLSQYLYLKHNKTKLSSLFHLRRTVALIFSVFQFAEQDRSESFLACGNYEDTSSTGHQGKGKTGFIRGRYPDFIPRSGVCQHGALTLPWSKKVCFCFDLKVKSVIEFFAKSFRKLNLPLFASC